MPGILAAQVRLLRNDFLPVNTVVNTFHFAYDGVDPAPAELTSIQTVLEQFYNVAAAPSTMTVASMLSNIIYTGGHRITIYDLTDPLPRSPVYDEAFTLGPHTGAPLPAEVALCLSYRGVLESGVPAARRRGRIYIGPLTTGVVTAVSGSPDARPTSAVLAALADAGARLITAAGNWGVWSPTALAFAEAVEVSVDDAWDTQRRRGATATGKVIRPV